MILKEVEAIKDIFRVVEESYDKMGERYHRFRDNEKFKSELEKFVELLPESGKVLDAGCGVGTPVSQFLAKKGFNVTGVDISKNLIYLAKENVPEANFYQKNILELDFPDSSFDGIICVYTLWHIPRTDHSSIIMNFHRMLNSNGILVLNTGMYGSEGMSEFFGEPMLWSNNNPSETLESVKKAGFEILFEGPLILGGEKQYWVFARKSTDQPDVMI
ncbi:class I SAM-dependent methyltransferase [Candidatus Thorarchaeota archaeon]|nr:MAG: class I SAM-dependent methyltransferase [Candidatus Thorarchaeota archaeon]